MLPTNVTPTNINTTHKFEDLLTAFGKSQLAIYRAKYLLHQWDDSLMEEEKIEIKRELWSSNHNADILFQMMMELGIPEYMISEHLHPEGL